MSNDQLHDTAGTNLSVSDVSLGVAPAKAPVVLSVLGAMSENSLLTISGTGFSANRQGQIYYSDFQDGVDGALVNGLLGNETAYKYNGSDAYTGSQSAIYDIPVGGVAGSNFPRIQLPEGTKKAFVHAAVKINKIVEGNDDNGGRQAKLFRIIGGHTASHTATPHMACNQLVGSNTIGVAKAGGAQFLDYGQAHTWGTWQTMTMFYELGDNDTANGTQMFKAFGAHNFTYGNDGTHFGDDTGVTPPSSWVMPKNAVTVESGADHDFLGTVCFPFYIRESSHWQLCVDSVFINDSQEAVLIGDNPDLTLCTLDTLIAIPMVSRASDTITAKMKRGQLSGSNAYLFARNANGLYNETGISLGVI